MKIRNLFKIWVIGLICAMGLWTRVSCAELTLTAMPLNGGSTLRINRNDIAQQMNQEVRIRITSTDGKPYQVFQRLIEPLSNNQGYILPPAAVKTYTIAGSNTAGTLYQENLDYLPQGEQMIYSSAAAGGSDMLTVSYLVQGDQLVGNTDFNGRIVYTARSIGTNDVDMVYLPLQVESANESKITLEEPKSRRLALRYEENKTEEGLIHFVFTGNPGGAVKIDQEIIKPLQNDSFEEIGRDVLLVKIESNAGQDTKELGGLVGQRTTVYDGHLKQDDVFIKFLFNPDKAKLQKAGIFRGQLQYDVDTSTQKENFTIDVEVEIVPVFKVTVVTPPDGLNFTNILPSMPPQIQELTVKVASNLMKPYSVIQNISTPLTNPKGEQIKNDYFSFKVEPAGEEQGKTDFPDFKSVPLEDKPIFFSDKQGTSSEFKVLYRLLAYPGISAGDFSTEIKFSLGEM
ncbi:MAG: hypothetical protein HQL23_07680 [Candidatus Omnitrophica bacterium]|nr:hypothetical protein [Candidatus Omnitrophota bacterium]